MKRRPGWVDLSKALVRTTSLADHVRPGTGQKNSWKRQPWHKPRPGWERDPKQDGPVYYPPEPKKKRGRPPKPKVAAAPPAESPSPEPLPEIKVNIYGEHVYDWGKLSPKERKLARTKRQDRAPAAGARQGIVQRFSPISGVAFDRRVRALGLTVGEFSVRTGITREKYSDFKSLKAGRIPIAIVRLVEFEETMAELADISQRNVKAKEMRQRLEALVLAHIARITQD